MAYSTSADDVSTGFKGYAGIFATRQKYDLSDKVVQKSRYVAKMITIISKNLTKISVTNLEPQIFEYTSENDVFSIYNAAPGTGTTFELLDEDAQLLQANDVLSVVINSVTAAPSQERIIVVTVGAAGGGSENGTGYTDVTVRRGGSPINITDGTAYTLVWLGNSTAENEGGPQPRTKEPNYVYNYVQLFTKAVGESEDVKNSDFYAKSFFSINGQMTRARDMLMKNINNGLYLGERDRETSNDGNYRHFTGGLYELIPTANKVDLSGNLTINYFNTQSSLNWFKQGNMRKEKMMSCGPQYMTAIENMFHSYGYELKINERISKYFGVVIKSMDFSGGTIHFLREDSFIDWGYSNCSFLWDMDYISYMYLSNRDIQVRTDVTNPSEKWNKTKWLIFGRIGLFRTYDTAHWFFYNPSEPS
jgi:hypothetical protein